MTAIDILKVLEKREIATTDELAEEIGINRRSISESLNSMLNFDVDRIIINVKNSKMSYVWIIKGRKISKEKLNKYNQLPKC